MIATISLFKSNELDRFQKMAQLLIVWILPILGAKLILNLIAESDPDAVRWVPQKGHGWLIIAGTYHDKLHSSQNNDNSYETMSDSQGSND